MTYGRHAGTGSARLLGRQRSGIARVSALPERTVCAETDQQLVLTPAGQRAGCHFAGDLRV